jgi:hypothetical protein
VGIRYWVSHIGIGLGIVVASTIVITWITGVLGLFGRFFGKFLNVPSGRIGYALPRRDRWTSGWW